MDSYGSPTAVTNVQRKATLVAISPPTACALVLTHAYAGLWAPQFLEAGLLGRKGKLLPWEGRKEGRKGGVFSDGRFFLLGNEDVCFFFLRKERGNGLFFLNLFIW